MAELNDKLITYGNLSTFYDKLQEQGGGGSVDIESVTYAQLKAKRDSSLLQAGQQYRITDYVTTTALDNTQSAEHPFDLIVTVIAPNKLSETGIKAAHCTDDEYFVAQPFRYYIDYWTDQTDYVGTIEINGTTYYKWDCPYCGGYILTTQPEYTNEVSGEDENGEYYNISYPFAGFVNEDNEEIAEYNVWESKHKCIIKTDTANDTPYLVIGDIFLSDSDSYQSSSSPMLESWEIKYCLDNDTDRFNWADEENGKGVIYYLKDEFNNECDFDFKNILKYSYNEDSYLFEFGGLSDDTLSGKSNNNKILSYIDGGQICLDNDGDNNVLPEDTTFYRNIKTALPVADSYTLGCIKIGNGFSMSGDGDVADTLNVTLPVASNSNKGIIMVGDGLYITNNGILTLSDSLLFDIYKLSNPEVSEYLTIESTADNCEVRFPRNTDSTMGCKIECSTDGSNWTEYDSEGGDSTTGVLLATLNNGDKLYLRSKYQSGNNSHYILLRAHITFSQDCYMYGNIISLFDKENFKELYTSSTGLYFSGLFKNNTHILNHPNKKLVMPFINIPHYPNDGANYLFRNMFEGCTGLTSAPDILARNLDSNFNLMFNGCSNLRYIKCLAISGSSSNWLSNVASSGLCIKSVSNTRSNLGIPIRWTVQDF